MSMHIIATVAASPEFLFLITYLINAIGCVMSLIAIHGALMRGWDGERTLMWMSPIGLAALMKEYGWWPLLAFGLLVMATKVWQLHQERNELLTATKG